MSNRGEGWVPIAAGLLVGAGVLALIYKFYFTGCRGTLKDTYNQQASAPYKCTCRKTKGDTPPQRERKEKEAAEAQAKIKAAQAEAKAKAAGAAASQSGSKSCTPTCKSAGGSSTPSGGSARGRPNDGFFAWLFGTSGDRSRQAKPAPHDCLKPKATPPPRRNPIFFWLSLIFGTILLYIAFAYLLCTLKHYDWRSRLANIRAIFCDPCATVQFMYGLLEGIRNRLGSLMSFRSKPKACRPKPPP